MTIKNLFEDFRTSGDPVPEEDAPLTRQTCSAASIASDATFFAGDASGWDDACRASVERGERISAELERAIQDLGFSYHEALDQLRGQFLDAMAGFLDALLPEAIPDVLIFHLEAALSGQTDRNPGIEFVVSTGQLALFEGLIPDTLAHSVTLV